MTRLASRLTDKATVREVAGGPGAVATQPIAAGELVAVFGGWVLTLAELKQCDRVMGTRAVQIADDAYLAPLEADGPGDLINHSCDPTCGILGSQLLVARRDIAPGETLTFDYATTDSSDYDEFDCACGSALCRGKVTGQDWLREDLRERHRGWFSAYLQARINA
jgi:hypothetical protein